MALLDSVLTEAQHLDSALVVKVDSVPDARLDSALTEPMVSLDSGLMEAQHLEPVSYPLSLLFLEAA
jgi:hypothetical protein